ncbi:MAG: DUF2341 domain-containing protein [bacterium]
MFKKLLLSLVIPIFMIAPASAKMKCWSSYQATTTGSQTLEWSYYKNVTIGTTNVSGTVTNFPTLLVIGTDTDIANNTQNSGNDIRITDSNNVKIPYEIEYFTKTVTANQIIIWFPGTWTPNATSTIRIHYGQSTAASGQNITGVWDSNFKGVWHQDETSGTIYDSTSFANNGIPNNGVVQDALGKIDGADDFNGTTHYIDAGNSSSLQVANGTIMGWVKPDNVSNTQFIAGLPYDDGATWDTPWTGFVFSILTDVSPGTIRWYGSIGGTYSCFSSNGNEVAVGNLYYIGITWDGSVARIYKNGAEIKNSNAGWETGGGTGNLSYGTPAPSFVIGMRSKNSPGEYYDGISDEVRISNIARSANWIATEYNNQNNPFGFYTIGIQQTSSYTEIQ